MRSYRNAFKWLGFILLIASCVFINAEENAQEKPNTDDSWNTKPVITEVYEQERGKIYLEWKGTASSYQVFMDGKHVQSVDVSSALINVKKGVRSIKVVPSIKLEGSDINVGIQDKVNLGFSLEKIKTGTPSDVFSFDYVPTALSNANLPEPKVEMNADNNVLCSFVDKYHADEYFIIIKDGDDVRHVRFLPQEKSQHGFITKDGNNVTILLDSKYLSDNYYMPLELEKSYVFSVQLRKYTKSLMNGKDIHSVVHETKESKELRFTPIAAWRVAPVIQNIEQTGEGQIKLSWTHEPNSNIPCEYEVVFVGKALIVNTGEAVVAKTKDKEVSLFDIPNGDYHYYIVPSFDSAKGFPSAEKHIKVKNTWHNEPKIKLSQAEGTQVKIEFKAAKTVEKYRIKVFVGDSSSVLHFVNMDYKEHSIFDIPVEGEKFEAYFSYDGEIDEKKGVKLKFEISGVKTGKDGNELIGNTGSANITLHQKK